MNEIGKIRNEIDWALSPKNVRPKLAQTMPKENEYKLMVFYWLVLEVQKKERKNLNQINNSCFYCFATFKVINFL